MKMSERRQFTILAVGLIALMAACFFAYHMSESNGPRDRVVRALKDTADDVRDFDVVESRVAHDKTHDWRGKQVKGCGVYIRWRERNKLGTTELHHGMFFVMSPSTDPSLTSGMQSYESIGHGIIGSRSMMYVNLHGGQSAYDAINELADQELERLGAKIPGRENKKK